MADVVDDIKSRLSIEEVVSQYVQLKKAGRNFKGLCPFHSEKTPSFVVSPEKQICHCFGCNKGGDIFVVIQELEGVSFVEAMKILADRAGVKLDNEKVQKKVGKSEKDEYYRAHELAADFFQKELFETENGKKVLDYLYRRGLKDEVIKQFKLGFAPDEYDALYPELLKQGLSKEVLLRSGLVSAKNIGSDQVYDKYRARLIFPIFDSMGKICGFGGRALKHDQAPKYLNSSENPIYNKSKILYGLHQSRAAIKGKDQIVVVEGYFDYLLPYQAGIQNIVATCGTALSNEHVKVIKRLTTNVVCCFDTDNAGFEATKRAYFLFQNEGIPIKIVRGIDQKDPADFVRDNGDLKALIDMAPDFVSFLLEKLLKNEDVNSLSGRRVVISELLPFFKQMSPVEKDFFVRDLAKKLTIQEKFLYEEIENYELPKEHLIKDDRKIAIAKPVKFELEDLILGLLLEYPDLFKIANNLLLNEDFEATAKDVYNGLTSQYNSLRENFKEWSFEEGLLAEVKDKLAVVRLYAEEKYSGFSEETLSNELEKLVDKMKKNRRIKRLKEIHNQIVEAEKDQNIEKLKELLKEQQAILNC